MDEPPSQAPEEGPSSRAQDLLAECLELPTDAQDEAIERVCRENPDLADTLRKAYAFVQEAGLLEETALPAPEDGPGSKPAIDPIEIKGFRILDVLGEGGMGTVYLAEQFEPVRRRVALKVIKLGLDSKAVVQRFEQERQALAMMDHEGIARVFDCGTTNRGQPYFVMELVRGIPLNKFCEQQRLSLPDRLRLMQQVCAAVQHAHQKGVVHRDLKPGNVLVSDDSRRLQVKVIDFGLAKAMGQKLIEATLFTEAGQVVGTPEYMAPEQADPTNQDIDTRVDIYSLGVMLYEVLVGQLPFSSDELRRAGMLEVQRILREVDPPKPSTKLTSIRASASEVTRMRGMSLGALQRVLKTDLDWVVLKALEKERNRRYDTANALAADLRRFLDHEPLVAGPPSAGYRVRKLLRRYRGQVVAASLVFLALIAGSIATYRQYLRAEDRAVEAKRQTGIAEDKAKEADQERKEARRQEGLAKAENERFNRLKVVVQLEDAQAELKELQPAWPKNIGKMEAWLDRRGKVLTAALPKVQATLRELQERRSLPWTDAQKEADRRAHHKYPSWQTQQRKVAALRRAMSVRTNGAKVTEIDLPATTREDRSVSHVPSHWRPIAFNNIVWAKVDPGRETTSYGGEVRALALARRLVRRARQSNYDKLPEFLDTLAWALFANGLDREAMTHSREALDAAPTAEKGDFRGRTKKLQAAISGAKRELHTAELELARLDAQLNQRRSYDFTEEADQFLHKTMRQAERELVVFLGERGARLDVQRRLIWARQVEALTNIHPNARFTWTQVRDALRKADGVVASELYGPKYHKDHPINLTPQTGLVPIGMNPVTKLWEFYHLRSAYDPRSDADPATLAIPEHRKNGSIEVTEKTGIVFVLLPGGTFVTGAQSTDPNGRNYDPHAGSLTRPPYEQTVAPFFLARHELTQGQWVRLSLDENPSGYPGNGAEQNFIGGKVTPAHPVESVDWYMCTNLLELHGLQLPHDNEWEYGCRAGTTTAWYCGKDVSDLEGHANVMDLMGKQRTNFVDEPAPFNDNHVIHAPVGTYHANPFGLYDVHGNVAEWCRNLYNPTGSGGSSRHCSTRGGSFYERVRQTRCARRGSVMRSYKVASLGLRAARALD